MNLDKIIKLSSINNVPVLARHAKMTEECGEFAEALLHNLGYSPHKTMKEPIEGEAADVIICVIDVLREVYRDLSTEEFKSMLQYQLDLKSKKWESILNNSIEGK
jgi:NTP pyrophosphatase (non-canonical NTP hydrolase)